MSFKNGMVLANSNRISSSRPSFSISHFDKASRRRSRIVLVLAIVVLAVAAAADDVKASLRERIPSLPSGHDDTSRVCSCGLWIKNAPSSRPASEPLQSTSASRSTLSDDDNDVDDDDDDDMEPSNKAAFSLPRTQSVMNTSRRRVVVVVVMEQGGENKDDAK